MGVMLAQTYWEQLKILQERGRKETNTFSDKVYIDIDLNTRKIELPPELQDFISLERDHRAETLYFRVSRYFDDVDLMDSAIVVEYINAKGQKRLYPVSLLEVNDNENTIVFAWCLGADLTLYEGTVTFAVRFFSVAEDVPEFIYNLGTLPVTAIIKPGIGEIVSPETEVYSPSQVEEILQTINNSKMRWINV